MANDIVRRIKTELEISGEKKYTSSLSNITAQSKLLDAQLQELEAKYAGNAEDANYLAEKQNLLAQKSQLLADKVATIKSAYENSERAAKGYAEKAAALRTKLDELQRSSEDTTEEQEKLAKEIAALEEEQERSERRMTSWATKLSKARTEEINLINATDAASTELKDFDKAADDASDSTEKMDKSVKKTATDLEQFLAAAGVTVGVEKLKEQVLEAEAAYRKLNASVSETKTLIDEEAVPQTVIDGLEDEVKQFAKDMNVLTSEVTPALYNSVSAGQSANGVFEFLQTAQKAAVAGVTDINTAADGLTSIVNAYGEEVISAERTSDILFATVKKGKTTFSELSSSIYQVVPTAASLGVGLEDIGAAFATITVRGVPTATAATQLRQVFTELSTAGSKTDKTFREISGGSFKAFIAAGGSLGDALALLEKQAADTGTEFSDLWSSVEARNAALNLTGKAAADFATNLEVMKTSAGATAEAYEIMADTGEYSAKRVEVATEAVSLAVGEALAPALQKAREEGADILEAVAEYLSEHPEVVRAITSAVVTVGTLTAGLAAAKVATMLFNSTLIASPWGIAAVAIGTLAGCMTGYALETSSAENETKNLVSAINDIVDSYNSASKALEENRDEQIREIESLDTLVEKYDELNSKASLSATEKETLTDIVSRLSAVYGDLDFVLDKTTGKYSVLTSEIERNRSAMIASIETEYEKERASEAYNTARRSLDELGLTGIDDAKRTLESLKETREEIENRLALTSGISEQGFLDYFMLLPTNFGSISEVNDKISAYSSLISTYNEAMSVYDEWISKQSDSVDASEENRASTLSAEDALLSYKDTVSSATTTIGKYNTVISDARSGIKGLDAALAEYNSSGEISIDTVLSLMEADQDYAQAITVTNGKVQLNTKLLRQLTQARKENEIATLTAAQNEKRAAAETAIAVLEAEIAKQSALLQTGALRNITDNLGGQSELEKGLAKLKQELKTLREEATADEAAFQKTLDILGAMYDGTIDLTDGVSNAGDSVSKLEDTVERSEDTVERSEDSLRDFGDAVVDALENRYEEMREAEQAMIDDSISRWQTWEKEQVSAIQSQIDALDELKQKEDEETKSADLLRKWRQLEYEARFATDDYNRLELQKQAAAAKKEYDDYQDDLAREEEKESLLSQIEGIKANTEKEIAALNTQSAALDEKYNSLTDEDVLRDKTLELIKSDPDGTVIAELLARYNPDFFKSPTAFEEGLASLVTGEYIEHLVNKATGMMDTVLKKHTAAMSGGGTITTNNNRKVNIQNITVYANGTTTQQQARSLVDEILTELNKALN